MTRGFSIPYLSSQLPQTHYKVFIQNIILSHYLRRDSSPVVKLEWTLPTSTVCQRVLLIHYQPLYKAFSAYSRMEQSV